MRLKTFISKQKILICSVLMILFVIVTGFVWGQKRIQVTADGQEVQIRTLAMSPEKIISQAGFQLGSKDEYRLSTEKVQDRTEITVYRAVPVTLTYQQNTREILTGKPTVGELLTEMGFNLETVRVDPSPNTKITSDVHINVVAVSEKIIERAQEEPYPIIRRSDAALEQGNEEVMEYGANGMKSVKVKEHYHDGVKVSEEILEETVVRPVKPQLVRVGARDTIETSRGAMRFRRAAYMEATAYLPSDGNGAGITATGIMARHGVVAVDPNVIPLGSRLYIPGYGIALAADTGGAIRGNIIDLCMEDYGEAISFGRRTVKVYILD